MIIFSIIGTINLTACVFFSFVKVFILIVTFYLCTLEISDNINIIYIILIRLSAYLFILLTVSRKSRLMI